MAPTSPLRASAFLDELTRLQSATEATDHGGAALSLDDGAARGTAMLLEARAGGRKVILLGNGGSSAIVSHTHSDLCKAVGVRAMVFQDTPLLTALANDEGYDATLHRPLELWAEPGDVVIAISSSGRSENILRSVRTAAAAKCRIMTFSGFTPDNPLRSMGEVNFYVPSSTYSIVELSHGALAHFLTDSAMLAATQSRSTGVRS